MDRWRKWEASGVGKSGVGGHASSLNSLVACPLSPSFAPLLCRHPLATLGSIETTSFAELKGYSNYSLPSCIERSWPLRACLQL